MGLQDPAPGRLALPRHEHRGRRRGPQEGLRVRFKTRALTLDEQTYASFVPVAGQTVGVGMPVIIRFDVPVTDKASIEKHLKVISHRPSRRVLLDQRQRGPLATAHVLGPGTNVTVNADIAGVAAGNGIYGQTTAR